MSNLILPNLTNWLPIRDQALSGIHGANREPQAQCQINAHHDYEALLCWLNEYIQKPTTYRTYRKEAERFLLWSIYERGKALSSLTRDDIDAYLIFLDDPTPKEKWCGVKKGYGYQRGSTHWRPFTGALSPNSKITAISAIDSLLNYWVDARYIQSNPMRLIRKKRTSVKNKLHLELDLYERILTPEEWHALLETLDQYPSSSEPERHEKARLQFLISILYFLGLRVSELANHTWNAFRKIDDHWWFYVMGKGDKLARIPVSDELLRAVIIYRSHLKQSPYPSIHDTQPLIASFTTKRAITPRQINGILKKLALETSKKFASHPEQAKKIKKFSAHWLRHLSATMQDKAGIAFKHIRANHRHENDETTRRYVHAIDLDRHQDMQKLKLRLSSKISGSV